MLTVLAFLTVYAAGCLLAILRHPIYAVMTYVLVLYVSPSDRWWGQGILAGVRWSLIAAAVGLVALLLHRTRPPPVPFLRQPLVVGFLLFVAWVAVQSFWALNPELHQSLLVFYLKFAVAMYLIYRSVDSVENFRLFLWANVLGCTYLGWIVYTSHTGGRFDSFGGAGIGDSNNGALAIITGIMSAGALFLSGRAWSKLAMLVAAPLMVNAIVATMSRSAFLALVAGGVVFNAFSPPKRRKLLLGLSALGLAGFVFLTNPDYWGRMESLQYRGEQVQGVDTGHKRLTLAKAQLEMSRMYPLGCGSRCTDTLSPLYLDESQLTGGARSSHNTFLTMLVEHGIPGAAFYLALVSWIAVSVWRLWRARLWSSTDAGVAMLYAAVGGSLAAIVIGDLFVQYPKFEIRFWFLTLAMLLLSALVDRDAERSPVAAWQRGLTDLSDGVEERPRNA